MKKLLLLFILGITYAVDCPICNESLIEIPGNPNAQSKNTYACSNKHSFHLTPEEFTQFDQANSTEKSKINYCITNIGKKKHRHSIITFQ